MVASLVDLVRAPSVTGTDVESDLQHASRWHELEELGFAVDAWKLDLDALREHPDFPGHGNAGARRGTASSARSAATEAAPGAPRRCRRSCWAAPTSMSSPRAISTSGRTTIRSAARDRRRSPARSGRLRHEGGSRRERRSREVRCVDARRPCSNGRSPSTASSARRTAASARSARCCGGLPRRGGRAHRADKRPDRDRERRRTDLRAARARPGRARQHEARGGERARRVPARARRARRARARAQRFPRSACSPATRSPTRCRSAASGPATGPAACPTCSSRKAGSACSSARRPQPHGAPSKRAVADACASRSLAPGQPRRRELARRPVRERSPRRRAIRSSARPSAPGRSPISRARCPPPRAAPYGSDLRLYSGIGGIPTLHYGPGDVRFAHAPREQVGIGELVESARALALLAVRRCGAYF